MKILPSSICFVMLAGVACSSGDAPAVDAGAPDTYVAPAPGVDATTAANDTGMQGDDAGSDDTSTDDTSTDDASSDDTSTDDAGDDSGVATDTGAPATDGAAGGLVINEILGKDVEFVELYNTGNAAFDLSGWGVSDAKDSDAGPGGMRTAATFPSGTTLAAGAYALVYGAAKDGGDPIPACMASACVTATWNISNSSGAEIYLENPAATVVEQEAYPAGVVTSGKSWARLPNGTGAFALATATPGAANTP